MSHNRVVYHIGRRLSCIFFIILPYLILSKRTHRQTKHVYQETSHRRLYPSIGSLLTFLSIGSAASVMTTWKVARSLHHFSLHLLLCLFRYLSPVEVLIFYILKSLYYVRPPHSSTLQWRLRRVQLNLGPANLYLFVCSLHWLTIISSNGSNNPMFACLCHESN